MSEAISVQSMQSYNAADSSLAGATATPGSRVLTFQGGCNFRDIGGYQVMYRVFRESFKAVHQPGMSLERALEYKRLMDQIYGSLKSDV